MKKSFGRVVRLPHLAGAFGRQCRTDDDKVRLLSVISRSSLSDEAPAAAADANNNNGGGVENSSDDGSSRIEHRNEATNVETLPCFSGIDSSNRGQQLIDVVTDTSTNRETASPKADEEKRHEWVFTLYDFDGKGTPNKEDILSIVRAIYDVLGNAKIRARANQTSENLDDDRPPTLGAFKIKLSLTADENADVAVARRKKERNDECRLFERRRSKRREKAVDGKMKGSENYSLKVPPPPSNENGGGSETALASGYDEESPLLRHHKKPTKRRGGGTGGGPGVERHSPPPLHQRKIYRRSASFAQNNQQDISNQHHDLAETVCASCTYRDYVNLSELENCCSSHHAYHHDQPKHNRGQVHHIRHCDRHCHCPSSELNQRPSTQENRFDSSKPAAETRNGTFCLLHPTPPTAVVRRCADFVQQSISPRCCRILEPINNYGAAPSATTSMHVNVQARAYYQERSQEKLAAQKRLSANYEKENLLISPTCHERRHKSKDKNRMDNVRSWIMNDSSPAIDLNDKNLNDNIEQRGVADGSDRVFVEHKHIHKHNHYHHFYY